MCYGGGGDVGGGGSGGGGRWRGGGRLKREEEVARGVKGRREWEVGK